MSRHLREIRLSRLSFAALAALSVLVTVVIISGGGDRSSAELAAAAALHAHPVHVVTGPGGQGAAAVASTPSAGFSSAGAGQAGGAGGGSATGTDVGSGSDLGSSVSPSDDGTSGGGGQSTSSGGSNGASNNGGSNTTPKSTTPSAPKVPADLPKIRHVFEIALSTTSYASAFGPSSNAAYLRSLVPKGTLLSGFHSLGSGELADNLALVSGQGPDPDTAAGCTKYAEFPTGVTAKSNGLVAGNGCVYPETALTIGDQVSASGHVWKAYIADMGKQACAHPNSNTADDGDLPGTEAGYDTAHNPFIYFHSLLDLGDCATDDQDLSRLQPALAHASGAPTFSFIAPGQCEDASLSAGSGGAGPDTPSTTTSPTAGASTATTSTTATSTTTTATEHHDDQQHDHQHHVDQHDPRYQPRRADRLPRRPADRARRRGRLPAAVGPAHPGRAVLPCRRHAADRVRRRRGRAGAEARAHRRARALALRPAREDNHELLRSLLGPANDRAAARLHPARARQIRAFVRGRGAAQARLSAVNGRATPTELSDGPYVPAGQLGPRTAHVHGSASLA